MQSFWFGFLVGILTTFFVLYQFLKWILDPDSRITKVTLGERSPPSEPLLSQDIKTVDWPQNCKDFLEKNLNPNENDYKVVGKKNLVEFVTPTQEVEWLNVVVTRLFLAIRSNPFYKAKTCEKISSKVNAKLRNNSFLVSF